MKTIPEALFEDWKNHPVTRILQERLKELYYKDTAERIYRLNIRQPADQVAMLIAGVSGRNQLIEKFLELDKLKQDILNDISWEK